MDNEYATEATNLQQRSENFKGAKKLKNPYALKNMQKALENIKKKLVAKQIKTKGADASRLEEGVLDFELITSHYYVKLSPQNAEEESLIKVDPSIHVFDYPLDYEFTDAYLDSRTPDLDSIPEYYTSVVLGQALPNGVPNEVLEELYIPEEDPFFDTYSQARTAPTATKQGEIGNREDFLRHLLMEAYTLTGNETELLPTESTSTDRWIFGSKWYPSGNLKIWDDTGGFVTTPGQTFSHYEYFYCSTGLPVPNPTEPDPTDPYAKLAPPDDDICKRAIFTQTPSTQFTNNVPLEGAQVLIRQWFTIRQAITDEHGNFSAGAVRGDARYIIQWERHDYSIRNGSLFQAETRGPKENNEAWNYSIIGGEDEYHGMIHLAAHSFYYGDRLGLTSPPKVSGFFGAGQLKIAARETDPWGIPSSFSHIRSELTFGLVPQIHIKALGRSSDRVFGTTIHELAHAVHSIIDRGSYDNIVRDAFWAFNSEIRHSNRRLLETWPTSVEIALTVNRYNNKFGIVEYEYTLLPNGMHLENFQNIRIIDENYYTSAGWDMIDDVNQRDRYGLAYPIDRVSGYSIIQLEKGLVGAKSWNEWKDNIKNRNINSTSIYLDELFNNWTN